MNRFLKNEKSILALFIACALIFIMALPVFAEATNDVDVPTTVSAEQGEGAGEHSRRGRGLSESPVPVMEIVTVPAQGCDR